MKTHNFSTCAKNDYGSVRAFLCSIYLRELVIQNYPIGKYNCLEGCLRKGRSTVSVEVKFTHKGRSIGSIEAVFRIPANFRPHAIATPPMAATRWHLSIQFIVDRKAKMIFYKIL